MWRIVFVFLIVFALVLPVAAQDTPLPTNLCSPEGRVIVADALQSALEAIHESSDPSDALIVAQLRIASYRADCADKTFTSDEYGLDVVTDPINMLSGAYRVTLESRGPATMEVTTLGGSCGDGYMYTPPEGGAVHSVSVLDHCFMVLDIEGDSGWTLTYEPIVTE